MDEESSFDPLEALTVPEVAALLHVSPPTVRNYIKRCELRSVVIGRCRRIRRGELEAFIERRSGWGLRRYEPDPPRPADTPTDQLEGQDDIPY